MQLILKGGFTMERANLDNIVAEELTFTAGEIEEIKKAREMPIVFDEDCPEVTPEKAVKYRRVNPPKIKNQA